MNLLSSSWETVKRGEKLGQGAKKECDFVSLLNQIGVEFRSRISCTFHPPGTTWIELCPCPLQKAVLVFPGQVILRKNVLYNTLRTRVTQGFHFQRHPPSTLDSCIYLWLKEEFVSLSEHCSISLLTNKVGNELTDCGNGTAYTWTTLVHNYDFLFIPRSWHVCYDLLRLWGLQKRRAAFGRALRSFHGGCCVWDET